MEQKRRIALITGSAKGLGKTAALALADSGYDIVLNYVNSEKEAVELNKSSSRRASTASPFKGIYPSEKR